MRFSYDEVSRAMRNLCESIIARLYIELSGARLYLTAYLRESGHEKFVPSDE